MHHNRSVFLWTWFLSTRGCKDLLTRFRHLIYAERIFLVEINLQSETTSSVSLTPFCIPQHIERPGSYKCQKKPWHNFCDIRLPVLKTIPSCWDRMCNVNEFIPYFTNQHKASFWILVKVIDSCIFFLSGLFFLTKIEPRIPLKQF